MMSEEESHHDTLPGGEKLPPTVSISRFVACRSQEIQIMKNSLMAQAGTKLAFQTLPKHMRRRAMSHNVKRLPRRLRQIHLNQMKKSGVPTKQKRPSRRYRRRPRNLREEYTRRCNGRYKWLHTHLWHAKRFHMIEKWGYKLPNRPCDKAFRACYRAMAQHCLLQDISYFQCIEISGDRDLITYNVKRLCKPEEGLSINARTFVSGNREGELTLYALGETHRAIGNVKFQWSPMSNNSLTKLWLWIHPAFYENVKENLKLCFNNLANISMDELGSDLSRFRLTGPLSNAVVHDTLMPISDDVVLSQSYLQDYFKLLGEEVEEQSKYWSKIKSVTSTSTISPHLVLSIIVSDPRIYLPKKRVKIIPDFQNYITNGVPVVSAFSPLWEKQLRAQANTRILQDSEIAELRSKLLVPGTHLFENGALIPLILIQQPGNKRENIGLGGGWDIIIPSGWARTFWTAFVMRGARAGGLRESTSMLFEMGKSQFLQPDTNAGRDEELQLLKENTEKFFKKPPNKRVNYNKFKIVSPFSYNWSLLLKDWGHLSGCDVTVLRNKEILNSIEVYLNTNIQQIVNYPKHFLLPVKLICGARGCPQQFAVICLPHSEGDFKNIISEPNCEDKLQQERKESRKTHQSILKKLKKQRKMKSGDFNLQSYKEILTNYAVKMRDLWLPKPTTIRYTCSREIIGFVVKGGFSFSLGKGCATGYIVSDCLPSLKQFKSRILFRNTNSKQYKVAKLTVILE